MGRVIVALLAAVLAGPVSADYFVVTTDQNGDVINYKRFIGFSDCRAEFRRTLTIIKATGGKGWVTCIPEDQL